MQNAKWLNDLDLPLIFHFTILIFHFPSASFFAATSGAFMFSGRFSADFNAGTLDTTCS
jgi:hypothetical protein